MSRSADVKRQYSTRVRAFDARFCVRQHRPLGAAGGAGGVEDCGEVIGGARDGVELRRGGGDFFGERPVPRDAETFHRRQAEFPCEFPRRRKQVGPAKGQGGLGVAEEIVEFGERIGRVQRQQGGARPKAGEHQHDCVGRLVDLRRHPVARPDAEGDQSIGRPARALDERAVGQREGVAGFERELVGVRGGAGGDEVEQVGGGG